MSIQSQLIIQLQLVKHPEGGYYRRTHCATENIPLVGLPARFQQPRPFCTAIYYLLESRDYSALHRIKSDEIWHFYMGSPLTLYSIHPNGQLFIHQLGNCLENGEQLQVTIPAGCWFGAVVQQENSYALVGCVVAPGFDFADFELGCRQDLLTQYPHHWEIIEKLTKEK